jgi:hypothetical protein
MDKAIQVTCRFLNLFAEVIVGIEVENIGHQVQRILIVGNLGVQASKVEAIGQVFFVDFAKVLVAAGGDELRAPVRFGSWKRDSVWITPSQREQGRARVGQRVGDGSRQHLIRA